MSNNVDTMYVVQSPRVASVPVRGTKKLFPVRRIYCVGRNYAAHAIEMGSDPTREPPFFFQKNPDNVVINNQPFPYPDCSTNVHHEIELVVAMGKGGKNIPIANTLEYVYGYAVGIDMTRRELQEQAKKTGRPWEIGKAFEHSAPIGEIVPASDIGHPEKGLISIKVNGEVKQSSDLDKMIWKVPEMVAYLSELFELQAGDLIMSGTPEGVGPVVRGDVMEGYVEGVGTINARVT